MSILGWRQALTFPPGKVQLLLFFLLALVKLSLSSLAFLVHHGVVSRGEKTSKRLLPPPPDWFILSSRPVWVTYVDLTLIVLDAALVRIPAVLGLRCGTSSSRIRIRMVRRKHQGLEIKLLPPPVKWFWIQHQSVRMSALRGSTKALCSLSRGDVIHSGFTFWG
jgi:hypothetical protein